MLIPKTFVTRSIIDYYKQIGEKLPGHLCMIDGEECRVRTVNTETGVVIFETVRWR